MKKKRIIKKVTQASKCYFDQSTEDAIIKFTKSDNIKVREELYNTKIKRAIEKLVENVFNTFKFQYIDTSPENIQKEAVGHCYLAFKHFNPKKGKAFSYFSLVAKNFFIQLNNANYKNYNRFLQISSGDNIEENSDENYKQKILLAKDNIEYNDTDLGEFNRLFLKYIDDNFDDFFKKPNDRILARVFIDIFDDIGAFDGAMLKKEIWEYIRKKAGINKKSNVCRIRNTVKKIAPLYFKMKNHYLNTGNIMQYNKSLKLT